MENLSKVLARLLKGNKALKQGVEEAQILEIWPISVGAALAKHTRAVKLKGKTLMVEVDHPIWMKELHANKLLAIKQINEKIKELVSPTCSIDDIFLVSTQPKRNQYQNKG